MKTLLLIEDDKALLDAYAMLLTSYGHNVVARSSAAAGLAAWWERPHEFGLVVTDYLMEPRNGLELAFALRKLGCGVPILMVSGVADPPEQDVLDRHGVTRLLPKPFDAGMLSRIVKDMTP